jgi:hypothetical protein
VTTPRNLDERQRKLLEAFKFGGTVKEEKEPEEKDDEQEEEGDGKKKKGGWFSFG